MEDDGTKGMLPLCALHWPCTVCVCEFILFPVQPAGYDSVIGREGQRGIDEWVFFRQDQLLLCFLVDEHPGRTSSHQGVSWSNWTCHVYVMAFSDMSMSDKTLSRGAFPAMI